MQNIATFSTTTAEPRLSTAPLAWLPRISKADLREAEVAVKLEGSLPEWLKGRLLRTARASFESGEFRAEHWFDGLGMLYSFALEAPHVRFRQRSLESETAAEASEGRVQRASFGSKNQRSFLLRIFQPIPEVTDNANVNVVKLGSRWVALTESPHQLEIDETTLGVRQRVHFEDALPRSMSMTAHPHFDFASKQAVNLGLTLGRNVDVIAFEHAPESQSRREIARWSLAEAPYVHSFGLTRGEVVIVNHPFRVKPAALLWSNRGFIDHFRWKPEQGTELVVLDRQTGTRTSPRVFETEPLFVFHTVNTFRDGADLVIDLLAYEDARIIQEFRVENMLDSLTPTRPRLRRVRLHASGRTSTELLAETGFEFPSINYRKNSGERHRFVWGSTAKGDGADVLRIDTSSGSTRHWGIPGYRFGEPVFVPRPFATEEDDGVLLTTGSTETRAVLAVLDARSLEPHALAHLPIPLPLGFHGSFARSASA